jgi:hypothetical protein
MGRQLASPGSHIVRDAARAGMDAHDERSVCAHAEIVSVAIRCATVRCVENEIAITRRQRIA